MKTIAVVTTSRADYGMLLPVLREIKADPELELQLLVSGMHLSPIFDMTVRLIEANGFEIAERVEMLLSSDTPEGVSKSIGLGIIGFAQVFARTRPDILVVLGDRFEMYAAAVAALPFNIPVAHIHGGDVTQGAIDDALRHSMTKLSHLHFVATETYARRVAQLGEEPWRIKVCGETSLDNLRTIKFLTKEELKSQYGIPVEPKPLLVTYHPVTLEYGKAEWQISELLAALQKFSLPVIFTMPNADMGNNIIRQKIAEHKQSNFNVWCLENMGTQGYFSLMHLAAAMIGNSSSGIVEAPSFKLPVVNIGSRQKGRIRAANVIDVGYDRNEIISGIEKAISEEFRNTLQDLVSPFGDGHAADRIVEGLRSVQINSSLLKKRFIDLKTTK